MKLSIYYSSTYLLYFKIWTICVLLSFIPQVNAVQSEDPSPNIPFKLFAEFINLNFSSDITLATVLTILFSLLNNTDILNLHAQAKHSVHEDEYSVTANGWIKALATAIQTHLDAKINSAEMKDTQLFDSYERPEILGSSKISVISKKLDRLLSILDLDPYERKGENLQPLKPVSTSEIEPVLLIGPARITCSTPEKACIGRALHINTRQRDRTKVTLIKGIKLHENAQIVSGFCTKCEAIYYADHKSLATPSNSEASQHNPDVSPKDYMIFNKAKYIKIGKSIWADRLFTTMVVNSVYHFHASTAAYTEFWNYTFSKGDENEYPPISRQQIWKAFIHETTRQISVSMNKTLVMPDNLLIQQIAKEAYLKLGQEGIIGDALNHSCKECTHDYKATADHINANDNAAVVGIDENRTVPILREDAENTEYADMDDNAMETDLVPEPKVKMIVVDGIVMGPNHCAYQNCSEKLANARTGVFCLRHETPRFYCVETICAPCGVVIAWTKFAKSEGACQIVEFLENVYPMQETRPSYICIDKACVVLKFLINSHNWNIWKASTRFVVDSYHYINHRVSDYLCRTYCNPSPLNGSAPNLVVVERDIEGNEHYKRAFNTQACEQLNAWLGGFQSILNRMTVDNFNWTLHAMLFIHTQRVIQKQIKKQNQQIQIQSEQQRDEDGIEEDGVEINRVD
ncbi:hypothetical protein BDQ17DRAFT_1245985 [Cyathus striatus]|nr:hypothetical protein BDQ17DRAFT_1245985 [Cyathus striatus]